MFQSEESQRVQSGFQGGIGSSYCIRKSESHVIEGVRSYNQDVRKSEGPFRV